MTAEETRSLQRKLWSLPMTGHGPYSVTTGLTTTFVLMYNYILKGFRILKSKVSRFELHTNVLWKGNLLHCIEF